MRDIYVGPSWNDEPPPPPMGEYTAADQARGWGVPDDQLIPDAPEPVAPEEPEQVK